MWCHMIRIVGGEACTVMRDELVTTADYKSLGETLVYRASSLKPAHPVTDREK